MKFKIGSSSKIDSYQAIRECIDQVGDILPDIIFLSSSVLYDFEILKNEIKLAFPNVAIHGTSSCLGTMSSNGVFRANGYGVSISALSEKNGSVATALVEIGESPYEAGVEAITSAVEKTKRFGEIPSVVWVNLSPGKEEEVLEGIQSVIGRNVPIVGGSSADNTIEGKWIQCNETHTSQNAICLTVIYTDYLVYSSFHNGYSSTEKKGIVTKSGDREIIEINGENASEVYNKWTQGSIEHALNPLNDKKNILSESGLFPIARKAGETSGIPYYKLSHPEAVTKSGGITLFTDIKEGEEIICMTGSISGITQRARSVIEGAMKVEGLSKGDISGVLMTFCAGCMLTIGDDIEKAFKEIQSAIGEGTPFLSSFTFGELGSFPNGENCHGNLMISILLFTERKVE